MIEEVYDGTILASETVKRDDVIIHFVANSEEGWHRKGGGFRFGKAREWKPYKKILMVKVNGFRKRYAVDEDHVKCAYVGVRGDRDKFRVEWR